MLPAEIARYMKIELIPKVIKIKVMILFHASLLLSMVLSFFWYELIVFIVFTNLFWESSSK